MRKYSQGQKVIVSMLSPNPGRSTAYEGIVLDGVPVQNDVLYRVRITYDDGGHCTATFEEGQITTVEEMFR